MNIVLVMDQFDNSNNGTTVTARRLADNLRQNGHTVTVLAGGEAVPGKLAARKHTIPFFQKLIESQGMAFAKPDPELYYEAFKDADIVHFFMPFRFCREGEKHARQMKIPCVAGFHIQPENITSTLYLDKYPLVNRYLYHWFYKRFYNRFSHIHCPSRFIADQLAAHRYDADIHVVSNGVAREFVRQEPAIPHDGIIRVLMIGRLSREKRQDLIIKAVARSRYADRIQVIFAGKGPRIRKIRRLGRKLAHRPMIGFYSQEELIRLINSCDLYVHASDAEIEGISCLEAMACGLVPVISNSPLSATGQFALHEQSLFAAGDAADLARKIDFWIEHPDLKAELSDAYRAQQDLNRVDICVAQMEAMYRQAIDRVRHAGYKAVPAGRLKRLFIPRPAAVNSTLYAADDRPARRTRRVAAAVARLLLPLNKLCFGLRIAGREHLAAVDGGAVTVCNHIHILDCTMAKAAMLRRQTWITSLRENFEIPVVGHLVKALGAVALGNTPHEHRAVIHALEARLTAGDIVHFYPEGMLVPYHAGLRKLHGGAFSMAVRTGRPVVPMVLKARPNRGLFRLKRKPCLTLHVLPPEYPDPALTAKQARAELQARVEKAMREKLEGAAIYPLITMEETPAESTRAE